MFVNECNLVNSVHLAGLLCINMLRQNVTITNTYMTIALKYKSSKNIHFVRKESKLYFCLVID